MNKQLTKNEFAELQQHIMDLQPGELPGKERITFDEFPARPVFVLRNAGASNQQRVLIGIELTGGPLRKVTIEPREARLHNAQIEGAQAANTGGKFLIPENYKL